MAMDGTERSVSPTGNGICPQIILLGDDLELLLVRQLLIESAGFCVRSYRSDAALEQHLIRSVSVFVLCHTIDPKKRTLLVNELRQINPDAHFVSLTRFQHTPVLVQDGFVSASTLPDVLLETIRRTVKQSDKRVLLADGGCDSTSK